jgi:integrase
MELKAQLRPAGTKLRAIPRRINFTVHNLQGRPQPPAGKLAWVYDAKVPGLAMLTTSTGHKTFYCYRKVNGRPQRIRLGGFPQISIKQARNLTAKINGQIAEGLDPMEERRAVRQSATLQELFDRYISDHATPRLTARTIVTDKSRFKTCFEGWTSRKLATLRSADVRNLHAQMAKERGQVTANRAVQLLRRMFNWGKVTPNPAGNKAVDFFQEKSRDRFLRRDEMAKLFQSLDDLETNPTIRDFVYVSLWTGARRSNVLSMRWDEIDLNQQIWTVPAGKSKSGETMRIHLAAPAMDILRRRKNIGSEFVFPGPGITGHLQEPKQTWKKVLERAGLADLRLHDLRRSLGSWMAAGGTSLAIIGKTLGHHDPATTQIYARLDLDPVRENVDAAVAAMQRAVKATSLRKKKQGAVSGNRNVGAGK